MRKLEIGSVRTGAVAPDFETLDCVPGADHLGHWGSEPLPFPDCSFDEVYSSHTLEHVPWFRSVEALRELSRVLKPGGVVELWVPDFRYVVECYLRGRCGDSWRRFNPSGDPRVWANGRIFTYGPGEENWHRAVFDGPHLRDCLAAAGFADVTLTKTRTRGFSHGPIDLGARAKKPPQSA